MNKFFVLLASVFGFLVAPGVHADQINGRWQVVSQSPTQQELGILALQSMGLPVIDADSVVVNTDQQVIITDQSMAWKSQGPGVSGKYAWPIRQQSNKLLLDREAVISMLPLHVHQFVPEYFVYSISGGMLELTSSQIPGYGNRAVKYLLERND